MLSLNCKVAEELSPIKTSSLRNISSNTSKTLSSPSSVIAITSPVSYVIEPIFVSSEYAKLFKKNEIKIVLIKKMQYFIVIIR